MEKEGKEEGEVEEKEGEEERKEREDKCPRSGGKILVINIHWQGEKEEEDL